MSTVALHASRVLTPEGFQPQSCALVREGRIGAVMPSTDCPAGLDAHELDGDLLPGFIDLQVNGGGGVLFNNDPTVDGIAVIGTAHRRFGTTGFLPTLISDDLDVVARAIGAVDAAIEQGVPGLLGIHIEGPFLDASRKGIHDASKFRTLDAEAIGLLASLRRGRTLVTLAPECAPEGSIESLVDRGVIVAAGHTEATYADMQAAFDEGLSGVTHLFNAMSQLGSREPGAVGAALDAREAWCGIIVDGFHIHPASLRIALTAKGAGRLALVTDAMPPVGSDQTEFVLAGQTIRCEGGRCTSADGTLAGSSLTMADAVRNAQYLMGVDLAAAALMASAVPASILGMAGETGAIASGMRADLVLLDGDGNVVETWIGGVASS